MLFRRLGALLLPPRIILAVLEFKTFSVFMKFNKPADGAEAVGGGGIVRLIVLLGFTSMLPCRLLQ